MANASLMYITLSFYTMVRHIEEHLLSDGQSPKKKKKKGVWDLSNWQLIFFLPRLFIVDQIKHTHLGAGVRFLFPPGEATDEPDYDHWCDCHWCGADGGR